MVAVYFAHSYRDEDIAINQYFMNLMRDNGIMPSVDVPSNKLNSAKLERQFGFTSGLVCVLPNRANGPSAYILAEIWMALRSGKPTLVFAEDTIGDDIVPERAIHHRFSKRSYWRSTPDHLKKIEYFQNFTGKVALPSLRSNDRRRSVFLIGFGSADHSLFAAVKQLVISRNYRAISIFGLPEQGFDAQQIYTEIRDAELVIANVDNLSNLDAYVLGHARAALVPTITVTFKSTDTLIRGVPEELGTRFLKDSIDDAVNGINLEFDIFEDEAIEMDEEGEIQSYVDFLKNASRAAGQYDASSRTQFVQSFRDLYQVGSAGSAGAGASSVQKSKLI